MLLVRWCETPTPTDPEGTCQAPTFRIHFDQQVKTSRNPWGAYFGSLLLVIDVHVQILHLQPCGFRPCHELSSSPGIFKAWRLVLRLIRVTSASDSSDLNRQFSYVWKFWSFDLRIVVIRFSPWVVRYDDIWWPLSGMMTFCILRRVRFRHQPHKDQQALGVPGKNYLKHQKDPRGTFYDASSDSGTN